MSHYFKALSISLVLLLGACASEPVVDVHLVDIKPLPSTLFEQRAELKLRIQNYTEREIAGTGLDLRFIVNNRRLARGVGNEAFNVPPLSDTVISVVVSSSIFDTIRQLLNVSQSETFSYAMKGKVFAPGFNKRFSRGGEITREDLGVLLEQPPAGTNGG